jgi:hypothetical protein
MARDLLGREDARHGGMRRPDVTIRLHDEELGGRVGYRTGLRPPALLAQGCNYRLISTLPRAYVTRHLADRQRLGGPTREQAHTWLRGVTA